MAVSHRAPFFGQFTLLALFAPRRRPAPQSARPPSPVSRSPLSVLRSRLPVLRRGLDLRRTWQRRAAVESGTPSQASGTAHLLRTLRTLLTLLTLLTRLTRLTRLRPIVETGTPGEIDLRSPPPLAAGLSRSTDSALLSLSLCSYGTARGGGNSLYLKRLFPVSVSLYVFVARCSAPCAGYA